jgi:hypothetical protein
MRVPWEYRESALREYPGSTRPLGYWRMVREHSRAERIDPREYSNGTYGGLLTALLSVLPGYSRGAHGYGTKRGAPHRAPIWVLTGYSQSTHVRCCAGTSSRARRRTRTARAARRGSRSCRASWYGSEYPVSTPRVPREYPRGGTLRGSKIVQPPRRVGAGPSYRTRTYLHTYIPIHIYRCTYVWLGVHALSYAVVGRVRS